LSRCHFRDLAITPMLCDAWDPQTGKYGRVYDDQTHSYRPAPVYSETKLNSAYPFGGPKCLMKEIQKLSGLAINRFIAIDFAGFAKMVDAVGGAKVCSTTRLGHCAAADWLVGTGAPDQQRGQSPDASTAWSQRYQRRRRQL
jgi:LCP family protein required for cell wall assembly